MTVTTDRRSSLPLQSAGRVQTCIERQFDEWKFHSRRPFVTRR